MLNIKQKLELDTSNGWENGNDSLESEGPF